MLLLFYTDASPLAMKQYQMYLDEFLWNRSKTLTEITGSLYVHNQTSCCEKDVTP